MPSQIKYAWEEKVKTLPLEIKVQLLDMLWIRDLDDSQRARLRYVLQKNLDNDDNAIGLIPIEELERRENAKTEFSD